MDSDKDPVSHFPLSTNNLSVYDLSSDSKAHLSNIFGGILWYPL